MAAFIPDEASLTAQFNCLKQKVLNIVFKGAESALQISVVAFE